VQKLDQRNLATVLAALRFWGRAAIHRPLVGYDSYVVNTQADPEADIATNGGIFQILSPDEIDALCERLNCQPDEEPATPDEIERTRQLYAYGSGSGDNLEIDDGAKASRADDGAWVAAWVWLPNEDQDPKGCLPHHPSTAIIEDYLRCLASCPSMPLFCFATTVSFLNIRSITGMMGSCLPARAMATCV